jgi:uncharacterized protein GlcG (DUF336 family)
LYLSHSGISLFLAANEFAIVRVGVRQRMGYRDRGEKKLAGAGPIAIGVLLFAFGAMHSIPGYAEPLEMLLTAPLTVTDVENIIAAAATRAKHDGAPADIAVSDREGNVLAVFDMTGAPTNSNDIDFLNANATLPNNPNPVERTAIEKARTAAFLSSDQDAFSTLTAQTLVADHFPSNISNTPAAPLFGLQFSQLPCSDVTPGNGTTGALGGIPLYKSHEIAGGIGVDGPPQTEDERIALAGALKPYSPPSSITANQIYINGFELPWTYSTPPKHLPLMPLASLGMVNTNFPITATPPTSYPAATFAGVPGEIRFPIVGSSMTGPEKLTAKDVTTLITQSVAMAKFTRAAIREPIGVPARMQVGVTDVDGNILGVFRTNDATMFSLDIVVQKGRTVTSFSDPDQKLGQNLRQTLGVGANQEIAFTTRTIGFLAQPFYPPGIDGNPPGPLHGLQKKLLEAQPIMPPLPTCKPNGNGITVFPGSAPLYKAGILVGGLGISGDGVDQDDYVANAGAAGYLPDPSIRADQIEYEGTPLPFFKFPRQPNL